MKSKTFTKISISALSIVTTASIVGAITGTVAWFQYSTRAQVAYTGTSVHCSENLKISMDGQSWSTELLSTDTMNYLLHTQNREDTALRPVTTGAHKKDEKLGKLYRNPLYQFPEQNNWLAADSQVDYITFPLKLKVFDVNGKSGEYLLEKNIYLSDLTIVNKPVEGKYDISNALRVHYDVGDFHATIAKDAYETKTYGELDLNGDGKADLSEGYDENRQVLNYGFSASVKGTVAADDDDQLPEGAIAEGDIYYFELNKQYKEYKNGAFEEFKQAAETYSNHDESANRVVSDDSDPAQIKGNPIGKTVNAVPTLAELPNGILSSTIIKDVRRVNSENKFYEWSGSAWVVSEATAATNGAVRSLKDLIVVNDGDVYYAKDQNLLYKYENNEWVVDADELVDTLPANLPAIDDSYVVGDGENAPKYIWNGEEWAEGGSGSKGTVADVNSLPGVGVFGKRYYLSTDKKYHSWNGNGDNWSVVDQDLDCLNVQVTIYLEGWQKLGTKGFAADKSALPAVATYLNGSYHIGTGTERVNYEYDHTNHQWIEGGDGETGEVKHLSELPNVGDSFSTEDGKTYIFSVSGESYEWKEGEGSAMWSDIDYVESSFNIGMRFSSDLHSNH